MNTKTYKKEEVDAKVPGTGGGDKDDSLTQHQSQGGGFTLPPSALLSIGSMGPEKGPGYLGSKEEQSTRTTKDEEDEGEGEEVDGDEDKLASKTGNRKGSAKEDEEIEGCKCCEGSDDEGAWKGGGDARFWATSLKRKITSRAMKKIRMKEGKELLRSLAVGEDTLISSLEVPEDVV